MTHEPSPQEVGALLSEVLDLADQEVGARLSDEELDQRRDQIKRKVNYNQDAILCPCCKKRIRLNNNGRVRVHVAGKAGSDTCMGSNIVPLTAQTEVSNANNALDPQAKASDVFQKSSPEPVTFSEADL